ncbi:helix-turn-helix domain-containing protein [Alkalihalobacillus sp. TS-13]|uniref:helix-turn-helix domain-containing protein n=1 Tax=Alkalihalobacillus sp. TS-13 TaxID=2842455 RepID=UPI001C881EFE|nr:helix-turn-helix domain-containing protein [Alkalihalobacillus sp. TS-13]
MNTKKSNDLPFAQVPPALMHHTHNGDGILFTEWRNVPPQEVHVSNLKNHEININLTPNPVNMWEKVDGKSTKGQLAFGDIIILSAGESSLWRWDTDLSFYRIELPPDLLGDVGNKSEMAFNGPIELHHILQTHDPKLFQLTQWLMEDIKQGGIGGKLYEESLSNLLALHVLKRYTSTKFDPYKPKNLSDREINTAIQYIHDRINQNISLTELAREVNVSPAHLIRLFKKATGFPPHQYVIQLRVNRAKTLLLTKKVSISEVAAEVGFADQSHFHRHFKRLVGCTPREYLKMA